MARFDWYQGTVRDEPQAVRECLMALAPAGQWEHMRRAPHGYAFGDRLVDADGPVASVWWGGMHGRPHVTVSGEPAQMAAQLLRRHLPDHTVSRADVCTDYAEPGAYDYLQSVALDVARDMRIKVGTAGDHLLTFEGRTMYLGAASSHTRLRLYDKAAELRHQFAQQPQRLADIPADLARLEFQVRPHTPAAKSQAAAMEPAALIGSSAWSRELVKRVDGSELAPFQAGRAWRQSDHARAYAAMLAQYGSVIRQVLEDSGSPECMGLQIAHDLADLAEAKRKR